jgi:hypothetical protein
MGYHCFYQGDVVINEYLTDADRDLLGYLLNPEDTKRDVFFTPPQIPEALDKIITENPYIGSPFFVDQDGDICSHGEEENEYPAEVTRFLRELLELLKSRGYTMSGEIDWDASDSNDGSGVIFVDSEHGVEDVLDEISNPGPSWRQAKTA